MSVRSGRWSNSEGMVLAMTCDGCSSKEEGTVDEIQAAGWHLQSVAITPHFCPRCAAVMRRDMGVEVRVR